MSFEDMVSADSGASFEQKTLEMRLANRIICNDWDGNPRRCRSCSREIELTRLRLLNTTQCRACVQLINEDEDE